MASPESAIEFVYGRRNDAFKRCEEFVAIPSISALTEHAPDVQRMAQALVAELARLGMDNAEAVQAGANLLVCGEWIEAPGKPTVLVYGHYDVQPVDPLSEWDSDPFEPTVRGDYLYGRGVADMKGSLWAFLFALDALRQGGNYPVNLKFLLEGAEEVGSPGLAEFIADHRDRLRADVVVNLDGGTHSPDQPGIVYGLRGLAYFELEVKGPSHDLHSGVFGGSVDNPIDVLCRLIAGMHDADRRVTLPGFYDAVRPLDPEEREAIAASAHNDEEWQELSGAPALVGEKGYTTAERVGARPCLDVNGIVGGFIGEGAKTVLPAKALAKLSTRLVADQESAAIKDMLCEYVRAHAPDTVTWEVRELSHGPGAITDRRSPYMKAACDGLEKVFGKPPLFSREGGSVPVVGHIQQLLGIDSIMLGFGLPDSGIHGPNEKQHLPTLFKGIDAYIYFLDAMGRLS